MTFQQYASLVIAFILSFILMFYIKDYIKEYKLLRYFHQSKAYTEETAKKIDELIANAKDNKNLKLMPYVSFFQDQIISITKDKRLYLNKAKYNKRYFQKLSFYLGAIVILVTILVLINLL